MEKTDPLLPLLDCTLEQTEIPGLPPPSRGKVRDVYDLGDRLLIVTTDRISAFDVVLGTIPCKGQTLNHIAAHWFERTRELCPNHMLTVPDPCAMVVKKLSPVPLEIVMRRFITGSLWREYEKGAREIYGLLLPEGLRPDQRLDEPILTPTTKEAVGEHDRPIAPMEALRQGLVSEPLWYRIEAAARRMFEFGEQEAARRGLLLVDTKYEFGLEGEQLFLMDEVHTPDSSRYWEAEGYQLRFERREPQIMLDKENIRQWLLQRGFSGNGTPPALTPEVRLELARTYLGLEKRLTGREPTMPRGDVHQRLTQNLKRAGIAAQRMA